MDDGVTASIFCNLKNPEYLGGYFRFTDKKSTNLNLWFQSEDKFKFVHCYTQYMLI